MAERRAPTRILATAPLRGPGRDRLRALAEVVEEPWIAGPTEPIRLLGAEQLAARSTELGADVVICEADSVKGPVLDLPLVAVGSTRGDPTNVDVDGATAKGIPVLRAPGATPTPSPSWPSASSSRAPAGVVAGDARRPRRARCTRAAPSPTSATGAGQLAGRTIGVVGLRRRRAGPRLALRRLGMDVRTYDPYAAGRHRRRPRRHAPRLPRGVDARRRHPRDARADRRRAARPAAGRRRLRQHGAGRPPRPRRPHRGRWRPGTSAAAGARPLRRRGRSPPTTRSSAMANVVLTPHIGGATFDTEANHTSVMADGLRGPRRGPRPRQPRQPGGARLMARRPTRPADVLGRRQAHARRRARGGHGRQHLRPPRRRHRVRHPVVGRRTTR